MRLMARSLFIATVGLAAPNLVLAQSPFCKLGEEKWIAGCEVSCTASWDGTSARSCSDSCSATPPSGWVMTDHRLSVKSESNGGHSISRMAANQKFDYRKQIEEAYGFALEAAGKKGQQSLEGKIKQDMNQSLKENEYFSTTHQMLRAAVNAKAHGSVVDRKRGWSNVIAEMKVRCFAPQDLQQQIAAKYGL